MRLPTTPALLVAALLLCVGEISTAHAHGTAAEVYQIIPSDMGMPAFTTTYGLVLDTDTGWRWVCSGAMQRSPNERIPVVRSPGGEFLGATFGGLRRAEPNACGGELASPLLDRIVIDIVTDENTPSVIWALTSDGRSTDNGVFRSVDGGESWSAVNETVSTILFERLRIAPGNSDVLYLSGAFPRTESMPERRVFTFRSVDAGASFESFEFPLAAGERNLYLLGVDPLMESTVYARVVRAVESYDQPERLVVSRDGGETWETLLSLTAEISGFAQLDGRIYVSAPQLGSYEDSVTGEQVFPEMGLWVSEDSGASFEHLQQDVSLTCLNAVDGELWACASHTSGPWDVGRSADAGRTFEGVFSLNDLVGPVECPGPVVCEVEDADLVRDYALNICLAPPCAIPGSAGVSGGGCSISDQNGSAWAFLVGFGLLFFARRRRT
ncbi:MAG: WD40/YVTN/BNR-like repeat-containing protein [Polyangiales bacterium]